MQSSLELEAAQMTVDVNDTGALASHNELQRQWDETVGLRNTVALRNDYMEQQVRPADRCGRISLSGRSTRIKDTSSCAFWRSSKISRQSINSRQVRGG